MSTRVKTQVPSTSSIYCQCCLTAFILTWKNLTLVSAMLLSSFFNSLKLHNLKLHKSGECLYIHFSCYMHWTAVIHYLLLRVPR